MSHLTLRGLPNNITVKTCTSMIKNILKRDKIKKCFVKELSEIHGRYAKLAVLEFSSAQDASCALKKLNGLDFNFDGAKYPLSAEMEEYTRPTPYYNSGNQKNNYNSNQNFAVDQSYHSQEFIQYPGFNHNQQAQGTGSNLGFRDQNLPYENMYESEILQTYNPPAFNQQNFSQGRDNYQYQDNRATGSTMTNYDLARPSRDFGNGRSNNHGNRESGPRGRKSNMSSRGGQSGQGSRQRDRRRPVEFDDRGGRQFSGRQERSRSPRPRHNSNLQDQATKIDMEIEILRKQRIIIEEERRLLMEKKKLELLKERGPQAVLDFERSSSNKRRRSPTPDRHRRSFAGYSGPRGPDKFMGPPRGPRNDRPPPDLGPKALKRKRPRRNPLSDGAPVHERPRPSQVQKGKPEAAEKAKKRPRLPDGVIPKFVLPCKKILSEMNHLIFSEERTASQAQKLSKLITLGLRKRLFEAIKNQPYMSTGQIHKLYRDLYPLSSDKDVIDNVLKAVKKRREMMAAKKTDEEKKAANTSSGVKDEIDKDNLETKPEGEIKSEVQADESLKPEDENSEESNLLKTDAEDDDKTDDELNIDESQKKNAKKTEVPKDSEEKTESKTNADAIEAEAAVEVASESSSKVAPDQITDEKENSKVNATAANDVIADAAAEIVDANGTADDKNDSKDANDTSTDANDTTVDANDTTVDPKDTTTDANDTTIDPKDTTTDANDTTVEPNDTTTDANDTVDTNVTTVDEKDTIATDNETADASIAETIKGLYAEAKATQDKAAQDGQVHKDYNDKVGDILSEGDGIENEADKWIEGDVGWDDIDEL